MRPGGPWQRLCHCPFRVSGGLFKITFSHPGPACAVMVGYPRTPSPHNPPNKGKKRQPPYCRCSDVGVCFICCATPTYAWFAKRLVSMVEHDELNRKHAAVISTEYVQWAV